MVMANKDTLMVKTPDAAILVRKLHHALDHKQIPGVNYDGDLLFFTGIDKKASLLMTLSSEMLTFNILWQKNIPYDPLTAANLLGKCAEFLLSRFPEDLTDLTIR